ncbi:hypothetical protein AAF712_014623 [Marasmius tenuissimus]|uniref:Uncharacterized protein n=1 Tax=Marasmius tenuissimus TaxID=585030 RepID=A0ABR2ZCP4_9AGAR
MLSIGSESLLSSTDKSANPSIAHSSLSQGTRLMVIGSRDSGKLDVRIYYLSLFPFLIVDEMWQFVQNASGWRPEEPNELGELKEALESPPFDIQGNKVILIYIPGSDDLFDDFWTIAHHVVKLHQSQCPLHGVIFLHPITDTNTGPHFPDLLTKLLGSQFLPDVSIVTTRWEDIMLAAGRGREKTLMEHYSKHLNGATVVQHRQDTPSLQIVEEIVSGRKLQRPRPLRIQTELVNQERPLRETGAGSEVGHRLVVRARCVETKIREIKEGDLHDDADRDALDRQFQDLKAQLARLWKQYDRIMSGQSFVTNVAPKSRIGIGQWVMKFVGYQVTNTPTY